MVEGLFWFGAAFGADGTTVTASRSARNLGVVLDDQLDFKEQVAPTPRSCRFLLHNIRRIPLYLTTHSTQLQKKNSGKCCKNPGIIYQKVT